MWKWVPSLRDDKESLSRGPHEDAFVLDQGGGGGGGGGPAMLPGADDLISLAQVQLGTVMMDVVPKAIAVAREELSVLIRETADSRTAYIIHNAKNPSAAPALLINPDVLTQRLAAAKAKRTLGQVIDALPFKSRIANGLDVRLPDDVAPELQLPRKAVRVLGSPDASTDKSASGRAAGR